jgi:membrane protease YdiL (CAAX protease family)
MPEKAQRRASVAAFFAITYILSWTCWIPLALLYPPPAAGAPGTSAGVLVQAILGNYGPTVAALLMLTLFGKRRELKDLLSRLRPRRVNLSLLLSLPLLPLGVLLPAVLAYALAGGRLADLQWGVLLPSFLLSILVSGLGEELGWRGYALPRLQARHGALGASALLGLVWALWHLPAFVWTATTTGAGLLAEYALYALVLVAYSIILTRVYDAARGSLWPVVLLHAAITATGNNILGALSPGRAGAWMAYLVYVLSACGMALLTLLCKMLASPRSKQDRVLPLPQVRTGL